jgi:hypothetical protein
MDQTEINEFFSWLKTANDKEKFIEQRRLAANIVVVNDDDLYHDIRFKLHHLEEDMLADLTVNKKADKYERLDLAWKLYLLSVHPKVKKQIRQYIARLERDLFL